MNVAVEYLSDILHQIYHLMVVGNNVFVYQSVIYAS